MEANQSRPIDVVMLPIALLDPNPWNPNIHIQESYDEYRAEVEHLGRLPHPITVRTQGERYQIVNGEHGYRIARELDHKEVPCQILDLNDFEARRYTYKANQHGKHNRVREGRMFQEMKDLAGSSNNTEFAKEIGVSEGKIRTSQQYLKADEIRNRYVQSDSAEEIGALSVRQVQLYLKLPDVIRDKWLDAGAHPRDVQGEVDAVGAETRFGNIVLAGLAYMFEIEGRRFVDIARLAVQYTEWRDWHGNWDEHVRAAAERMLPVEVLDLLPITTESGRPAVAIAAEQWTAILDRCRNSKPKAELLNRIAAEVRIALRDAGVDPRSVHDTETIEKLQVVQQAPDHIRQADHLSIDEQYELVVLSESLSDEAAATIQEAVCAHLHWSRCNPDESPPDGVAIEIKATNVSDMTFAYTAKILRQSAVEAEDHLFGNRDRLVTAVLSEFKAEPAIGAGKVGDRSAADVLEEHLQNLPDAELQLLAAALLSGRAAAGRRWLLTVGGELPDGAAAPPTAPKKPARTRRQSQRSARPKARKRSPWEGDIREPSESPIGLHPLDY